MNNMAHAMQIALEEAAIAALRDEVPVGAVVLSPQGVIIARAGNCMIQAADPTAHAEIMALRAAAKHLQSYRLDGHFLVSTLEPCAMCAGAIAWARIAHVHYAASDPKSGGVLHGARVFDHAHHKPAITYGESAVESRALLQHFFIKKRRNSSHSLRNLNS